MTDIPSPYETGWFVDEEALGRLVVGKNDAELVAIYRSLIRADFAGLRAGAVATSIEMTPEPERPKALLAVVDAMKDDDLAEWVEADSARRARAEALAMRIAPEDPSEKHNHTVIDAIKKFDEWKAYPHHVIIVPGYTPRDIQVANPGVHPVCRRRLEQAYADFRAKKAPFVLVSGANVYPRETPYYEALEMKAALVKMGLPEDRVLVDARARHSTTNLRNAGRIMLSHGLSRALVACQGGGVGGTEFFDQDFYFSNPTMSTFYARCEKELGYRIGDLKDGGDDHAIFEPSPAVRRINWRDPLDP